MNINEQFLDKDNEIIDVEPTPVQPEDSLANKDREIISPEVKEDTSDSNKPSFVRKIDKLYQE